MSEPSIEDCENVITLKIVYLHQVEVNVQRDPSRLYRLTQGWEQRKKEGPAASGGGAMLQMPHRYGLQGVLGNNYFPSENGSC